MSIVVSPFFIHKFLKSISSASRFFAPTEDIRITIIEDNRFHKDVELASVPVKASDITESYRDLTLSMRSLHSPICIAQRLIPMRRGQR